MNEDEPRANDPDDSAYHAVRELHYGRLGWLAEHIRRSDFRIDTLVAQKLLAMLEGTEPDCLFEIRLARRSNIPPRASDPRLQNIRNFEMAMEVARLGGFKRGHLLRACHEVARLHGLHPDYVRKSVSSHRETAVRAVEADEIREAYERGEVDFLGRSKSPQTGFVQDD
tara:strand:- start:8001 stop:8507 length:507 start_codon:yes stop_codon:yes gene_type:complete